MFGDNPSGWALGRMGQIHMGRANPFRALVACLAAEEFLPLSEAVDERRCREEVGVDSLAEAAAAYGPDPKCPGCGAWRDSFIAAGVPKWRCRCCGGRLTSLTSVILEHCQKALPVWVTFIRLMRPIVPVECAAELFGVTHKTAFEWRHRVLATVSGFQDRTVLRDTVWVDERYINDTTSPKATGNPASAAYSTRSSAPASPSTFKMNPDAVACGHGKLSSARMRGP